PMVLRFYQAAQGEQKGAREYLTMDRLSTAGFCVPHPYAFEADPDPLNAPFMIMEKAAGGPLLNIRNFPQAFRTFSLGFFQFVRSLVKLHRLNPAANRLRDIPHTREIEGIPLGTPLLDRMLAIIADRIEKGPLPGLRDAMRRLAARAGQFRVAEPSLLHMDYHPMNVLVSGIRVTGVIDWVNADVGDRHLDAAMTTAMLSSHALEHPSWMRDNTIGNSLRGSFTGMFVALYHAMARLDFERLRYCQALGALYRLSTMGMMQTRGPETVGYRPNAVNELTPAMVRLLVRFVERKSGASVRFGLASQTA